MSTDTRPVDAEALPLDRVVIRFAGDSGDGMQLAGTRFTAASAVFGNDLATLPNYPAEIRAPAGTLAGVSSFQVQIADWDILTPGDDPDVLVAMNPAALKANLADLPKGGIVIVNTDAFDERNLHKVGYTEDPITDGTLDAYEVLTAPMDELTKDAVADSGVTGRDVLRSKNLFALGLVSWIFGRPLDNTVDWLKTKFSSKDAVARANISALQAGYNYGITTEAFQRTYEIRPAKLRSGTYTNVTGNQALAWGVIAAGYAAKLPVFYGSYPITPASTILEELARHKHFGVRTFQAEDEISAIGAAVGAAFAGSLGVTGTSGPGLALKSETASLAVMLEIPLLIIDVQRGGPSTGLPTKTEQSDLLFAIYGRHGESPMPVVSASSPSDAFETALEAARVAVKFMTPVTLLTDGYIANSSEPWQVPDVDDIGDISKAFTREPNSGDEFLPYLRDPETLARPWAIPGTPGLEHRVGGLEKENLTGNVSYDPENHQLMTRLRREKLEKIAGDVAPAEVGGTPDADLLVVSWGSTRAAVLAGVNNSARHGVAAAHLHLRWLNPFPANLGEVLGRYKKILVPELNDGQLVRLLRAEFLLPAEGMGKVQGYPFKTSEIEKKIMEMSKDD